MSFIKNTPSIDLGDTPIENIFIDVYMPMANGTFVKVYLLGYKYACDPKSGVKANNMTIAKNLNIPLSDVLAAWDFWESKQIIKKHFVSEEDETNYTVEFISLKQLYIDNNYKLIHSHEFNDHNNEAFSCSTKQLVEANKIPEIKEMFMKINQIIDRPLVPNEKKQILEWFYNYNIDPPLIVKAYSYCKHKKNIKKVHYVAGVIRNWYDLGISTVEQLQEHLMKQGEKFSLYDRIFKAMGFDFREPSEAEMEIMDKWVDQFHFSLELILLACKNCSKTSNPNINYIDSILTDWYNKGVKNIEDVKTLDQKKKSNEHPKLEKPKKIKTRFHLSESRGDKYTAEELEAIVLNNQKRKFNR